MNVNKFKSIAYGYSNQITALPNDIFDAISIFLIFGSNNSPKLLFQLH